MKRVVIAVGGLALASMISGCMTNEQGQTVLDPDKVNVFVSTVLSPGQQAKDDGDADADDQGYAPAANDQAVASAQPSDVVVQNGDTYVMATDASGHRRRVFYGHGDMRAQVVTRHALLQQVIVHNGGALPSHAIAATHTVATNSRTAHSNAATSSGAPARMPAGSAVASVQHASGATPAKAAAIQPAKTPAAPAKKDPKKTT
jgi:hypothetical protein